MKTQPNGTVRAARGKPPTPELNEIASAENLSRPQAPDPAIKDVRDEPRVKVESQSKSEPREVRIAHAAYLKAQARGFEPGGAMDDWLEAEREVDAVDRE